ncbi:OmpA family protein [Myroides marinus]|uniref:OmpA family protein n=1 Tax=Myroides marinus TaxID=703342 RepID=UPI002576AA9A|nr:OmpA family protein [Myroides marinus]MDM1350108.1 OmpA family protein [Myroides marinus]MDM1357273.1 OmpA family protein [Myroides marinus]MDM1501543.1 OmpA family protein [Myroides marinus]
MKKQLLKASLLSIFLLAVSTNVQAQRSAEKKADKEYSKLAYIDAIKIYEKMAKKGYVNADILMKLSDSYYFNGKLLEANKWYNELFNGQYDDKNSVTIPSEYYYRYAQTLKAAEQYDESKRVMEQFVALEKGDSRSKLYLANKDYLNNIKDHASRYTLTNTTINTPYSDYGAAVVGDQLIFTSARPSDKLSSKKLHEWTNESFTTLYSSTILADGKMGDPVVYAPELSSKVNDATAVFTKDGKTMFFTRNNSNQKGKRKNNKKNSSLLKIYSATKQSNGTWGDVRELPINSDNFNTAHPALTPDNEWLYFSSDREGVDGQGQSDIYRVTLYPNHVYGGIENIGKQVNTAGRETFPFISSDNYLFFASDGHPGLGGLDIFSAKIDKNGKIGEVVNVGAPINSPFDDFSIYISRESNSGYVSSNRPDGLGGDDIYSFIKKACLDYIKGTVYDIKTNKGIPNATVVISDGLYEKSKTIQTDEHGNYSSESLDCSDKYRIKAEATDYSTVELVFASPDVTGDKVVNLGLDKASQSVGINDDLFKKLKLQPIYFDFDKSFIRRDASIELIKVVEVMKEYPTMKIDVRSHTDSRGNDMYNLALSDRRVKATIQWMISQGIDPSRLTGRGYGETQLQNNCSNGVPCSEAAHQMNRRSEFIVTEL